MTSSIETSESSAAKRTSGGTNRRNNLVLRALIDEMLERVRELNRSNGVWTSDERAWPRSVTPPPAETRRRHHGRALVVPTATGGPGIEGS